MGGTICVGAVGSGALTTGVLEDQLDLPISVVDGTAAIDYAYELWLMGRMEVDENLCSPCNPDAGSLLHLQQCLSSC